MPPLRRSRCSRGPPPPRPNQTVGLHMVGMTTSMRSAATRSAPVTVGSPRLERTNCDDGFANRVVRLRATRGKKSVTWRLPDRLLGDTDLLYRIIQELLIELDTTMMTRRRSGAVRLGYAGGLILATPVALAIRVTQVLFAAQPPVKKAALLRSPE